MTHGAMLNLGSTEQAILHILWRDGPSTIRQIQHALQRQGLGAVRSTVTTIVYTLYLKGVITRTPLNGSTFAYQAVPKAALMHDAVERMLAHLEASPAERRQLVELLDAE